MPAENPKPEKAGAPGMAGQAADPQPGATFVAFTVDIGTGNVVTIEGVGAGGERRALSEEARSSLADQARRTNLNAVVEQAFQAGIDCVLGEDTSPAAAVEAEGEAQLQRVLLTSLIERSAAKRLLQREVLGPAIVGSLIANAASAGRDPSPASTATH